MSKRGHVKMIEKAAALAAQVLEIPYEHREKMSAEQVLSLLHFDHDPIPHTHGGPDEHFNLTPLPIMAHREKTAKHDIPQIAKTARIAAGTAKHQAVMAAKRGLAENDMGAVFEGLAPVGRPIPKPTRKIPSRKFNSKGKRKFGR